MMFKRMCSAPDQGMSGEIPGAELTKAPCLGKEKQVLFWAIEESSVLTGLSSGVRVASLSCVGEELGRGDSIGPFVSVVRASLVHVGQQGLASVSFLCLL